MPHTKNAPKLNLYQLRTRYKKDDVIFGEEDMRDNAYIIESGVVEISTTRDGRKIPLVRLGEGEVFGETALLGVGKRTASAIAVEDTEVFTIPPHMLRERILHLDPLVGLLMSLLVNRYRLWRYKSPDEAEEGSLIEQSEPENMMMADKADEFMDHLHKQKEIALHELRMAQEIARAIEDNQFVPYLQPIVSLPEQKLMGFESLIRWQHPTRGMVPPGEFIPIAERTHVVRALDLMMLKQACAVAPRLQAAACDVVGSMERKIYISVNLSGAHFGDEDIVQEIKRIIDDSGVDPAQLLFEITESALMGDPAIADKILRDLKDLGVRIALDDFGTGYSSLGYLHRFTIDLLKIDRSFVQDIHTNRKSMDIVRAIVSLAKTFNLGVVGEGIENDGEILSLSGIGCQYGQGYLFSKPLPVDKAIDFVTQSVTAHR